MPRPRKRDVYWGVAIALWAASVALGMVLLWRYKLAPTEPNAAPERWPASSLVARVPGVPTLVMTVHPRCSCSRASLGELARLMTDAHDAVRAVVLFVRPDGEPEGWERTDTWQRAGEIPGVVVQADVGGAESRRFGATVSGYSLLYDGAGTLLFHGGITGARGHEGDNAGRRRIVSLLRHGQADRADSPTFGCDLERADDDRKDKPWASAN